jgi:imidazolonepropionase-like amidohydrolase
VPFVCKFAALKAGVKTIEQGTYMDQECADLAKEKGAIYVPTRTIVKFGASHPELMSPESYKKLLEAARHHLSAYKLAVKSGVKITLGTDTRVSIPTTHPLALGQSGQELVYAVREAGMTEAEAIEAATAHGPDVLGELGMKPKSGRVEVGYDADLIALTENPLNNIDVLMKATNVTHVWKGGQLMKRRA